MPNASIPARFRSADIKCMDAETEISVRRCMPSRNGCGNHRTEDLILARMIIGLRAYRWLWARISKQKNEGAEMPSERFYHPLIRAHVPTCPICVNARHYRRAGLPREPTVVRQMVPITAQVSMPLAFVSNSAPPVAVRNMRRASRLVWCRVRDLNPRPSVYKTAALPLC